MEREREARGGRTKDEDRGSGQNGGEREWEGKQRKLGQRKLWQYDIDELRKKRKSVADDGDSGSCLSLSHQLSYSRSHSNQDSLSQCPFFKPILTVFSKD